ncbi:unnamed protein product [Brachionus calyciflorus]|uniref:RRM domain-containing protein n=1 Tax=Brachionus calyciflorus TaxID=104777 RepID=A0A813VQT9_9BILA|nr:unnamed protein product [Brachionus calyciflorus]
MKSNLFLAFFCILAFSTVSLNAQCPGCCAVSYSQSQGTVCSCPSECVCYSANSCRCPPGCGYMNVIKLRGLPWSCTNEDIIKFLDGINVTSKPSNDPNSDEKTPSIYLTMNAEGRPSGEAFIELVSDQDLDLALKKNNAMIGQRYIEVFKSNQEQLNKHIEESTSNTDNWSDPVVRLRGLPYGCTQDDIVNFFNGLKIAFDGLLMVIDFSGRFNGEAFVQFDSILDANKALEKHKQKIANRYIEVFRSTLDEMSYYSSNSNVSRHKQPNKINKRNANFNSNNSYDSYNNNNNSNSNNNRQNSNDFNRNRQKPYSRNMNQNTQNRPRNQNQNGNIPSLMGNFNSGNNNFMNNNNSFGYGKRPITPPFPGNNRTGLGVRLRGLPYSVTENQIRDFFKPLVPVSVILTKGRDGRPSGECECDFDSQNTLNEAMKYDKKYIGNRYIELFPLTNSNRSQGPMSLGSLMKQDFSNRSVNKGNFNNNNNNNTNNNNNNDFNGNGYRSFENSSNPMPVPPPPPLIPPNQSQPNSMTSLLGPVPPPPIGATNINEMIFADMAKQMTQLYTQFQTQQQQFYAQAGLNMMNAAAQNTNNNSRRF